MKLAVPYDNGSVYGHFGKAEQFKIYEIEGREILSSKVIPSTGTGHEELVKMLDSLGVDFVICGGIGQSAKEALGNANITVIDGAEGECDAIVRSILEGNSCSCGADGCDPEGCGGCSGCAGHREVTGKNAGHKCTVHYCGTLNDGSQFDSSYDRGQPLEFVCGAGMMIFGFDQAVANMEKGEIIDIHLLPEDAYGYRNPNFVFRAEYTDIPGSKDLHVGDQVMLADEAGHRFPVTVAEMGESSITFDGNHFLAGKELNFRIELVDVD